MNANANANANADVHALTGAYVLDAVSDEERVMFEQHLTECATCAQEVRELRATSARLGLAATAEPPPHLRTAVLGRIRDVRQASGTVRHLEPARRASDRTALRLIAAAAAILLVAAATLGGLLLRERQAREAAERQATAMESILRAEDAVVTTLQDPSGTRMTVVMSRQQDRMMLLADDLPPAPTGHAYQAWAMGAATRPAGLLVPHDGRASLEVSGIGAADLIGITIEPAGGSDRPSTDPVMEVDLP